MFVAYDNALECIRRVKPLVAAIAKHDPSLADQLLRAASAVPLDVAEGGRRSGKDPARLYRMGAGSAAESIACLDVALAWGWLTDAQCAAARASFDRELALLHGLTR